MPFRRAKRKAVGKSSSPAGPQPPALHALPSRRAGLLESERAVALVPFAVGLGWRPSCQVADARGASTPASSEPRRLMLVVGNTLATSYSAWPRRIRHRSPPCWQQPPAMSREKLPSIRGMRKSCHDDDAQGCRSSQPFVVISGCRPVVLCYSHHFHVCRFAESGRTTCAPSCFTVFRIHIMMYYMIHIVSSKPVFV